MPAPPPRKAIASSHSAATHNISGCWTMSDSRPGSRDQFHYEWFHDPGSETFAGTDSVSGGSDGPLKVSGRIRGSNVEWRVGELECSGRLADGGQRMVDGRCFQAGSSKVIGQFTGRRVGNVEAKEAQSESRPAGSKSVGPGRPTAGYPHRMVSLATAVFNEESGEEASSFGAPPTLFERVVGQIDSVFGVGASDRLQALSLDREISALERRRQAASELAQEAQHASANVERRLREKTELRQKLAKRPSIGELTTMCSAKPAELHSTDEIVFNSGKPSELHAANAIAFKTTRTSEYNIFHM